MDIPNGVTRINSRAFAGLKCLSSISLPSSLESIGEYAFSGCKFDNLYINDIGSWCKVIIESGNFEDMGKLYVHNELINDLIIPDGIKGIYDYAFRGIKSIKSVQFPDSLLTIGTYSFADCDNIERITFPNSIKTLGDNCFRDCTSLREIYLADGESSLSCGKWAFNNCPLNSIYLGRNVSDNAFQNNSTIKQVEIGEMVDNCRALTWKDYSDLHSIKSKALAPPKSQPFLDSQYKNVMVTIPEASKVVYEQDPVWGPFWSVFPSSISMVESQVTISPGERMILKVTLSPDDVTQSSITWNSSDDSVVLVDESGQIIGVKDGEAKITATTTNGLKAVCRVSVRSLPDSIVLNVPDSLKLNIGEPFQLHATVFPEGCRDNEVSWFSDNEEIVSVKDGKLYAYRHGTANISARTANGINAQCKIEVANEKFEIEVFPDTIDVFYGQEKNIKVKVNAKHISIKDIELKIESQKIAYFVNDSTLVGRDLGSTILTASYAGEVYTKYEVNVKPFKLTIDAEPHFILPYDDFYLGSLDVSIVPEELKSKLTVEWTASTTPGDSQFSSSSNSIMCWRPTTVNYKAYVVYGDYVFYSNKGVLNCTNRIISTPDFVVTNCGKTETIEASIKAKNWNDVINSNTKWESSDDSVVEIIESGLYECKFVSHKVGEATIKAVVNGGAYSTTLIRVEDPILISDILINADSVVMQSNHTFQLEAHILPMDATDKSLIWSSSDESVAIVTQEGLVTALNVGVAVITAKASDGSEVAASCKVIVKPILVTSISINRSEWSSKVGDKVMLRATVQPNNASDKTIKWSSSDESVATVTKEGLVTARNVGNAVITATAKDGSGVSATCVVTVHSVLAESISVSPEDWSGEEGESFQLYVTIMPEDATDKHVIYISTDKSVAEVDQTGFVSVHNIGNCKIIVSTLDGSNLTAECVITSSAGIEEIFSEEETVWDVYDINGVLLKKDCDKDSLKHLSSGFYILQSGQKTTKIIIR